MANVVRQGGQCALGVIWQCECVPSRCREVPAPQEDNPGGVWLVELTPSKVERLGYAVPHALCSHSAREHMARRSSSSMKETGDSSGYRRGQEVIQGEDAGLNQVGGCCVNNDTL